MRLSKAALCAVVALGALPLADCSTQNGKVILDPAVIDAINNAVAFTCNTIPQVESLVAIIGASFHAVAGATTIATDVANQVATLICTNVKAQETPTSELRTAPRVGATVIHGWHIVDSKLVQF